MLTQEKQLTAKNTSKQNHHRKVEMCQEHDTLSCAHTTTRDLLTPNVYLLLLPKSVNFPMLHVYNIFLC